MGRIMAVDYGQKRTGLVVTDMLKMIANRLTVVSSREATGYIARYVSQEPVDLIVVGYPKQMNNELSEIMKRMEDVRQSRVGDTVTAGIAASRLQAN